MAGGLVEPPIDDLLAKTHSKYTLSVLAAKRAREINSYLTQLNEGLLEHVGPLVEYDRNAKENPLNIAMREIFDGAIAAGEPKSEPKPESEVAAEVAAGVAPDVTLVGGDAAAATAEVDAPGESKSQAQDDAAESTQI
jgi:DNA-directed RNA polymerase subunit omega